MKFRVYGAGTPLLIEACSSEQAEMIVVDSYGVDIDDLVTFRELEESDVLLH
jgi:hypothetical protein